MTKNVIKEIPNLLENPVIVIDSKKDNNSRLIMGDLRDENGKTVTVVLLLTPTSRKGNALDFLKISSIEGRSHINSLFKYDDGRPVAVRYVDKKRIQSWLYVNRVQFPLRNLGSDSMHSIPQNTDLSRGNLEISENADEQRSIPEVEDQYSIKTSYSIPRLDKRSGVVYKNYISYSKIGAENINAIRIKLREIYKGIDDAIADNVPIEVGDTVFVVDSGKDNGKITFGVRRRKTIKNEVARKDFIRSRINDGLSEVSYSKELFEVFERELGKYSGRGMRREVGAELSDNQRQSENIEGEILRDGTDRGRSGLNRVKSDDGTQYSIPLTKDTDGKKLSPEQAEYFKNSKVRKKIPNEDRSGSCF